MAIRKYILFLIFCLQFGQTELFARIENEVHEPWMDSVIAEGVRKIGEAEALRMSGGGRPQRDWVTGETYGSYCIIIDAANWAPTLVTDQYYYERSAQGNYITTVGVPISDSVNEYNVAFRNRVDYIAYYNITINNFPFPLEKDISKVTANESQTMFAQLQALKAVDNQKYADAAAKFYTIINNITIQVQNQYNYYSVVCYGCANMLGQYGQQNQYRASFFAEMVSSAGVDTSLGWVKQMYQIPKLLRNPYAPASNLSEKNTAVSIAVRNFIMCNKYGVCRPSADVFTNFYARWLYSKLYDDLNIDKQKLMNTCMSLNQLSGEMAWSVVTADYENTYTIYNSQGLGIMTYRNSTLDTISGLVKSIQCGADQLKNNASIGRDSALYFGRLLYRIPSYMLTIPVSQRIHLLDVITNAMCSDIMGVTDAADYTNHCERICRALYLDLPSDQIRPFMDQLKSTKVIWDLSYRLDNMTFGFFGDDNYTEFIFTISAYWKQAYPEWSRPVNGNNIDYHIVKWSSAYFNSNSIITTDHINNTIKIVQQKRVGWQYFGVNVYDGESIVDIYAPVTIHVGEGSLIPDLPGVKDLTVPAVFLDWLSHKKLLDDIGTSVRTTIAIAALATGIGEFYQAACISMRIISAIEIAVSASDLILLNETVRQGVINLFPTPQEGQEFLASYEKITMAINFTVAAKGLVDNLSNDFVRYTTKFDEKEAQLSQLLGGTSDEFKGMKKLREEIGEGQNQVANNLAAGAGFDINIIGPQLATQPNTAFFWSGRTNGIGGQDIAMQIALSRNGVTLESKIASENIVMPEWDLGNAASVQAWEEVSAAYANQVSGEIRAVVGQQLRPDNIWETIELPRLKANPNVTKITTIDPQTLLETVIFVRP